MLKTFNILICLIILGLHTQVLSMGTAPKLGPLKAVSPIKCYRVNIVEDNRGGGGENGQRALVTWIRDKYYGEWLSGASFQHNNYFRIESSLKFVQKRYTGYWFKNLVRSATTQELVNNGILPPFPWDKDFDYDYLQRNITVNDIKADCMQAFIAMNPKLGEIDPQTQLPRIQLSQIKVVAQQGADFLGVSLENLAPQYPVIDKGTKFSETLDIDYGELNDYAMAANNVGALEIINNEFLKAAQTSSTPPALESLEKACQARGQCKPYPEDYQLLLNGIYNDNSKLYARAYFNPIKKQIIISYKGTTNFNDFLADIGLVFMNSAPYGPIFGHAIENSYQFYLKVKDTIKSQVDTGFSYPLHDCSLDSKGIRRCKEYPIVLTGHSLGGFLAVMVSAYTGDLARVFSIPATYISSTANSFFRIPGNNFIPLDTVLSIGSVGDPVMTYSGWDNLFQFAEFKSGHVESMVLFPMDLNPIDGHRMQSTIDKIILPNKNNPGSNPPAYIRIWANTVPGAGLKTRSNIITE